MASLGIAPHIIEAVLNHKSGAIGGICQLCITVTEYADEKREALEKWARRVAVIVHGDSNVVALRARSS